MSLVTGNYASPVGDLQYKLDGEILRELLFVERDFTPAASEICKAPCRRAQGALQIEERLDAYFAGDLRAFDGLVCDAVGTPFQKRVWARLREIPAAATCSYSDIAVAVGSPAAVRAVGAANGRNPIAIVVPCHRVIGKGGGLTGYAGGLARKAWLLAHETAAAKRIAAA